MAGVSSANPEGSVVVSRTSSRSLTSRFARSSNESKDCVCLGGAATVAGFVASLSPASLGAAFGLSSAAFG